MTKTFSFTSTNNTNNKTFFPKSSTTVNYSKILDDLIAADIIKKNAYLFDKKYEDAAIFDSLIGKSSTYTSGTLKIDDSFIKAANFLANYTKNSKKYNIPYTIGKCYYLADGTPIVFYEDEIQIGYDFYTYRDLANITFLNAIPAPKKNIIIDIYIKGVSNLNINIL